MKKHNVEAKHVDANRQHNLYAEFALYETIHEAFVDKTHKELFEMDTALNAKHTKKHQKEEQFGARRLIKGLLGFEFFVQLKMGTFVISLLID